MAGADADDVAHDVRAERIVDQLRRVVRISVTFYKLYGIRVICYIDYYA
jgi:hypothetical protein